MGSKYRVQVNDWLKRQSFKADQVLDVGGGEGRSDKLAHVEANRYLVLDNNLDTKPDFVHDLNEFAHPEEVFAIERNSRFDLIFCMHVFEYIWQPYNAIANLYSWLRPGGTLVINFPFLYPLHNPVGIDYLRYTNEWVKKMFSERFKFSSVEIEIIQATDGVGNLIEFYSAERMHRRHDDSWRQIGCIVRAVK